MPYGTCREPSNVQAGGGACPFQFRRRGCDHFRTDVSHLPELKTYLQDLLRDRERALVAGELDDRATTEGAPSDKEIGKLKELIRRVGTHLGQLTIGERTDVVTAIIAVRRTRQITRLGIPGISSRSPDREPASGAATSTATSGAVAARQAHSLQCGQRVVTALDQAVAAGAEIAVPVAETGRSSPPTSGVT